MVESLDVVEAFRRFPELVDRVARGNDEILISNKGAVVAKLVPFETKVVSRAPGAGKEMVISLAGFDDPLPDEFLKAFE